MSKSVWFLLYETLKELSNDEFRRFIYKLTDRTEGLLTVVEGKDCKDAASLLTNTFTEQRAVTLAVDLLKEINCRHTAEKLQQRAAAAGFEPPQPQKLTDITQLFAWHHSIPAQILLFYKPTDKQNLRELHVHLLPRNVPLIKVKNRYKDFIYIKTSSDCVLSFGEEYCLSCTSHTGDIYKAEPKVYIFECNYGPDYPPAFVLYVEAESVTLTLRDKHGDEQWELHHLFFTEKALPENITSSWLGESSKSAVEQHSLTRPPVDFTWLSPIDAHVLLFYRLTGQQNMRELHVHLLPQNVPLSEVEKQYKDFACIKTQLRCHLTPGEEYYLHCLSDTGDTYEAQSEVNTFKYKCGPGYHPAFVVYIKAESITLTLLVKHHWKPDSKVWGPHNVILKEKALPEDSSSLLGESSKSAVMPPSLTHDLSTRTHQIDAHVLLFYRLTDQPNMRELHVHLLPGNVPLSEVKNQYKDFMYIKTSSDCQLTPGRKYRLSCRSHTGHIYFAVPQAKLFKCNYGSNYHPAFVMYVESERFILTLLGESGWYVWGPHVLSLTDVELHKDTEKAFPEGSTCSWLGESSKSALAQQSFTEPESSTDAEKFVPTVIESHLDDQNNQFYRFLCQHAGQFQCKLTNLVFDMEGKGEVQYRTESWNNHNLDVLGQMKPAGPLYNIICVEGSVSHLHLPHAQIFSDEVDLAVAHFTGDNIEIIKPLAVTDTHIIIPIQGLSGFGVLTKFLFSSSVDDQILLFYKLTENFRELHIHLLPGNVDLTKVKRQYVDFMYIKTSSDCHLTPGTEYQPSCKSLTGDTYEAEPEVKTYKRTYSPNFHPPFVIYIEAKRIILTLLEIDGRQVWPPHHFFLTDPTAVGQMNPSQPTQLAQQTPEADFIDKNWTELVKRATGLGPILDALLYEKIINQEQYYEIKAKSTPHDQMRALITGPINSSGSSGKHVLYSVLKEQQLYMMKDLRAP